MKKSIVMFVLLAVSTLLGAQTSAREVLDKVSATFNRDGDIRIGFSARFLNRGQAQGSGQGSISIKGNKFMLNLNDTHSWFNGKTLWSYTASSEEVNISNPTREELQSINPYLILTQYQKNFRYSLGQKQHFEGKNIYEVELAPVKTQFEIGMITLYVDRQTFRPAFIEVMHNNGLTSRFTLTKYETGLSLDNRLFEFDPKQYPSAELIDLR